MFSIPNDKQTSSRKRPRHSASEDDLQDDEAHSTTSNTAKTKNTTSKFRAHYDFQIHDKDKVAICLECRKLNITKIVKRSGANTSGMKKHLEKGHPIAFRQLFPITSQIKLESGQRQITDMHLPVSQKNISEYLYHKLDRQINIMSQMFIFFYFFLFPMLQKQKSQEEWDIEIVDLIAIKRLSYNFFNDKPTQTFFLGLNSTVKMPLRDAARRLVLTEYDRREKIVKRLLSNNQGKISFTIDGWTSYEGRSYYGITAHFVGDDWKLHSMAVDFVPALGEHSGKAIARIFFECIEKYELQERVQGITVDNASANTTFMKELQKQMEMQDTRLILLINTSGVLHIS